MVRYEMTHIINCGKDMKVEMLLAVELTKYKAGSYAGLSLILNTKQPEENSEKNSILMP